MNTLLELHDQGYARWTNIWTDKQRRHQYLTRLYEPLFTAYRDQPGLRLLEIGSAHGGSLMLWADWFKDADIVGVDYYDNLAVGKYIPALVAPEYDQLTNYVCDAFTAEFSSSLGDFDIIIEDAEHSQSQMLQTLELYWPRVRTGGLLVIEDIHSRVDHTALENALPAGTRYTWHDFRPYTGTDDSVCLVVYQD